ncbi:MAG: helix-hairpin-helix domain-containing protein [bacterium]|nr:helix-hairpin-helix domain-containing protein [bacterium]
MNARFLAVLISMFVITLPVHANTSTKNHPEQHAPVNNLINLNTADLATLTGSFKGIGKKRAEAIIAYRESHHGYKSLEELAEVKGFGQNFMEKNRDKLKETFVIN